jgi:hypothetical protein
MYGVWYDITSISKDSAGHMNATATLSNGTTVEENGAEMMCIHFLLGLSVLI